jgi:hypothetical protein
MTGPCFRLNLTLVAVVLFPATVIRARDMDVEAALQRISALEEQVRTLSDAGSVGRASFEQPLETGRCGAACGSGGERCEADRGEGGAAGGSAAKAAHPLQAMYDKGFVLRPVDAGQTPFEMKINSWLQLRHSFFDSEGGTPDQNDMEFERARLLFSGFALSQDLEYFIQIDADDNQTQRLDLLDYYLSYDIGHDQFDLESGTIGIRAGRWKIPFNRTRYTSGLNLQFADRSVASVFFDIDRSVGMGLYGEADAPIAPINWEVALINGIRTNGLRPDRVGDLDRNLGVSGRVFSDVLGEWGSDFESDLAWHEELAVRLGFGFAFSREDIDEGPVEASRQRVVDGGGTLTSLLPMGASAYSVTLFAISADFRLRGWSLSTEYYFRSLSDFSGAAVPDLFDHGFLVQGGYFLIPEKLEVFMRWSRLTGDSGTLGLSDRSADEVAGGVAWWIKGRNLKLVCDVTRVNSSPINDSAVGFLPGDEGLLYRTQFQVLF